MATKVIKHIWIEAQTNRARPRYVIIKVSQHQIGQIKKLVFKDY